MSSSSKDIDELRVLSFNVWGLAFVSKDRPPRIQAIASYLAASDYDIVCLQELWIYKDFEIVKKEVESKLPYSRFFHTGALGSGLAIFTRFPIISAQALPYSLSGLPLHVIAGDFFVNKAAGNVVVLHPKLGEVEIWSTHMHAAGEEGPETNRAHRIAQAWQLANAIRAAAERGRYVIAAGDYNSIPSSLPIAVLRDHASVLDSWLVSHPQSLTYPQPTSAEDALRTLGMTCDSPINSYSAGKPLTDSAKRWKGKRLDYIFYRGPEVARRRPLQWRYKDVGDHLEEGSPIMSSLDNAPLLTCTDSRIVLTERVPNQEFSYSDHFGLAATYRILPPNKSSAKPTQDYLAHDETTQHRPLPSRYDAAEPLINVHESGSSSSKSPTSPSATTHLIPPSKQDTLQSALNALLAYTKLSRRTSNRHLRLFLLSIVFALGLTVSSAWQPKSWIQPIWTLLGVASGAFGATMLYVGFVWGEWESNLLKEVMEEMELERRITEMEGMQNRQRGEVQWT